MSRITTLIQYLTRTEAKVTPRSNAKNSPTCQELVVWRLAANFQLNQSLTVSIVLSVDGPGDARGTTPPLAARLVPRLLDCWSECTPAALAVKPDPPTAQSLVRIARILHLLLDHDSLSGQSTAQEYLPQLTHKVVAQFPVTAPGVRVSAHDIEDLVDLNLAVCQLMLPFFGGVGGPPWEGALVEYLQGVLEGRVLPGSGSGLAHGLEKRGLTEAQTGVVLASLGRLLRVVGEDERDGLLAAFTRFYLGCGPQSRSKAAALHFMGGLLQVKHEVDILSVLSCDWRCPEMVRSRLDCGALTNEPSAFRLVGMQDKKSRTFWEFRAIGPRFISPFEPSRLPHSCISSALLTVVTQFVRVPVARSPLSVAPCLAQGI